MRELATRLDLREDLAVLGETARVGVHPDALMAWGERAPVLRSTPVRAAASALSLLGAGAVVAAFAFVLSWMGFTELPEAWRQPLGWYVATAAVAVSAVLWRFRDRTKRIGQ